MIHLESDPIMSYISSCISPDDNLNLIFLFTIDEFKDALFQMDSNKSQGPNDLNLTFFKKNWNLLGPIFFFFFLQLLLGLKMVPFPLK